MRLQLEYEARLFHVLDARLDPLAVDDHSDLPRPRAVERSPQEPLPIRRRLGELDLRELALEALEIRGGSEPAIEAGGADLEVIMLRNQVFDVEDSGGVARDLGAVFE